MKLALKVSIALGIAFLVSSAMLLFSGLWPIGVAGILINAVILVLNVRKYRAL